MAVQTHHQRPLATRVVLLLVLVIIIPSLPAAALGSLGLGNGGGTWLFSAAAAALATILVGPRLGWRIAVGLAALIAIGLLGGTSPWISALVMGVGGLLYGLTARWGVTSAVVTAPIALAFTLAQPPVIVDSLSSVANAVTVGLIALAAGFWGLLCGWVVNRRMPRKDRSGASSSRTLAFAVMIGLGCAVAMWFVIHLQLGHTGAWMVLTLLIAFQPYLQDTWTKALHRLWGTILGFGIALVVGLTVHTTWLLLLLGAACLVIALSIMLNPARPYWLYATFLTPAVVLLEGADGSVVQTDQSRLLATALGVTIALVMVAISHPVYKRIADRLGEDHY